MDAGGDVRQPHRSSTKEQDARKWKRSTRHTRIWHYLFSTPPQKEIGFNASVYPWHLLPCRNAPPIVHTRFSAHSVIVLHVNHSNHRRKVTTPPLFFFSTFPRTFISSTCPQFPQCRPRMLIHWAHSIVTAPLWSYGVLWTHPYSAPLFPLPIPRPLSRPRDIRAQTTLSC